MPDIAEAKLVTSFVLVFWPMIFLLAVMSTKGIIANGIPNDSTTWDSISIVVGLAPQANNSKAGIIVMDRLSSSGIRQFSNPSITTAPA